ncbi:MAG TPA: hypothetical protein VJX23_06500 [Candidatus Binataceae bacterium]|nr:hypothetical protein [Candidatus Binataceae bacterium]
MTIPERLSSQRGATHLGFLDILTALVLLGILVFVSYLQFSNYQRPAAPSSAVPSGATPAPQ